MKRALPILLLIVFAFNIGGFITVFEIQKGTARKQMKKQIKEGIPESQLRHIIVDVKNAAELDWKHSNEFRYKGTSYDVVRISRDADGTMHYYCVTDQQETMLFAQLDEIVKQSTGTTSNSPVKGLYKILFKLYSPPAGAMVPVSEKDAERSFCFCLLYSTPSFDPASPPPWLG